jgi:cyclic pyranopterin phosphate synthase
MHQVSRTSHDPRSTEVSARRALARCRVTMLASTTASVAANAMNKGDVLATARYAGIQMAKQTALLLPMSHPVLVSNVRVDFTVADTHIDVEASVDTVDRTGVDMEALAAVTVAALTIYDMCKSADRTMTIGQVALWERSGGDAGAWRRAEVPQ